MYYHSIGVNRSESSDDNVIDPEQYDMLTQYENYPPPSGIINNR